MQRPRVLGQQLALGLEPGVGVPVLGQQLTIDTKGISQPAPIISRHIDRSSWNGELTTSPPNVSTQQESVSAGSAAGEHDKTGFTEWEMTPVSLFSPTHERWPKAGEVLPIAQVWLTSLWPGYSGPARTIQ